jgi:hypothetical protein
VRILFILTVAVIPALAQAPAVQLTNVTRPAKTDFQVGDRFDIVITGPANQPVSVRTTMQGRTDWGPVIGWTDLGGRWTATGLFEREAFGDWSEVWTVGGKLANPALHFSVSAPCLKGGQGFATVSGLHTVLTCDTAEGLQTFATPSGTDPFRTPDGRSVPGRMGSNMTTEQYRADIMQYLITSRVIHLKAGLLGDQAGALITKIIGANALSEDEMRNVLLIVRDAFEKSGRIPQEAKDPSETLRLLRNLADSTGQQSLKEQIAETISVIQIQ